MVVVMAIVRWWWRGCSGEYDGISTGYMSISTRNDIDLTKVEEG